MSMKKLEEKEIFFKALLVEDEFMQVKIMSNFLSQLRYKVDVVDTAENAIQRVHTKIYDLILTDLGLPDHSGERVIHEVRISDLNWLTPLIVLTAHANAEAQKRCLEFGADGVLIKPISKQILEKNIELCSSKCCVESNLAAQFQVEWMNCKELLETNPLILPNKKAISEFITRFKVETNKAMYTLEGYQKWISYEAGARF